MTKQLTLVAVLALGFAGGLLVKSTGETVQIVADTAGKSELAKADADAVLFDDAGQPRDLEGATVKCAPGGNLDDVWREDVEWCTAYDTDGTPTGDGWQRAAKGGETSEVIAGKVYSTATAVAAPKEAETVK